jgi:hypothetical protein
MVKLGPRALPQQACGGEAGDLLAGGSSGGEGVDESRHDGLDFVSGTDALPDMVSGFPGPVFPEVVLTAAAVVILKSPGGAASHESLGRGLAYQLQDAVASSSAASKSCPKGAAYVAVGCDEKGEVNVNSLPIDKSGAFVHPLSPMDGVAEL